MEITTIKERPVKLFKGEDGFLTVSIYINSSCKCHLDIKVLPEFIEPLMSFLFNSTGKTPKEFLSLRHKMSAMTYDELNPDFREMLTVFHSEGRKEDVLSVGIFIDSLEPIFPDTIDEAFQLIHHFILLGSPLIARKQEDNKMELKRWQVPGNITIIERLVNATHLFEYYSGEGFMIGYSVARSKREAMEMRSQLDSGIQDAHDFAMSHNYFGL